MEGGVVIRLQLLLAMFFPAAFAALPLAGATGPLALATAVTASVALVLLVCAVQTHLEPTATPARIRTIALRERARQSAFLRLRDPNASGRARPRAPSACSAAA
jgi:hypothetical protein